MIGVYFSDFDQEDLRERCRDEYLQEWTGYESVDRLLETWEAARPLCALHHAVSYQHIVESLEPSSDEMRGALPHYLGILLKSVPS